MPAFAQQEKHAPIIALLISALAVYLKYSKKLFPFLIPEEPEKQIYIYDFMINNDTAVKMAEMVQCHMQQASIPAKTELIAGMITEEVLMLIQDRNKDKRKPVRAECTLITQPDGVKLILRDSGDIFDLTDSDSPVDSFRQYIVSSLMDKQERKGYLTTTGYNRNEFFFSKQSG